MGEVDQRRRNIDGDDVGAARGEFTAIAPVPQPASSTRAPRRDRRATRTAASARISSRPARTRGANAADAARRRSGASRLRPPCGRSKFRARCGGFGRWRWSSVEPQELEQIAILHRRRFDRLEAVPELVGERMIFVLDQRRSPASGPSRTACISSGGRGGSRRDRGNARRASGRWRRCSDRSRRSPALRLAMTPPSRTSIVLRLGLDRRDDPVHREDGIEVVGGDDQRAARVLQRRREAAADDVAEHVEDDDVGIVEQADAL